MSSETKPDTKPAETKQPPARPQPKAVQPKGDAEPVEAKQRYRIRLHDRDAVVEATSPQEAWAKWCDAQKYWPSPRLVFGSNPKGTIERLT